MTWTRETTGTPAEFQEALRQEVAVLGGAVIFDHGLRNVDELNADVVELAWSLGWRGADAEDIRDIRRLMTVARGDSSPEFFHLDADEAVISEHLTWVADDCQQWLDDHCAPDGFWIGNDGERGAFGCWPVDSDDL